MAKSKDRLNRGIIIEQAMPEQEKEKGSMFLGFLITLLIVLAIAAVIIYLQKNGYIDITKYIPHGTKQ